MTGTAAARALRQDTDFLGHFVAPRSPSEVAPELGMAANLAHHHARRLADLGLLFEARRENGKVYYQLAAREFRVPSDLLPPGDAEGNGTADIRALSAAFLRAYERSWAQMHAGEEDVYGFGDLERPAQLLPAPTSPSTEPFPTHLDVLTLRLTTERFRRLARAISALLAEAQAEGNAKQGQSCTVAVLAFQDGQEEGEQTRSSRHQNSFLGTE